LERGAAQGGCFTAARSLITFFRLERTPACDQHHCYP
jgi:hypothetical protein